MDWLAVNKAKDRADQIVDCLYLGSYESAESATPDLYQAILSVISHPFPESWKKCGIEYEIILATDWEETDLLTYFPYTNKWIAGHLEANKSVLVHCAAGISRSATIVCAYLMQKCRLSVEEAINWIKTKRPISPNNGFVRQLELFYEMGYKLNANNREFRNYLIDKILGDSLKTVSYRLNKYSETITGIEEKTKVLELGREYRCRLCTTTLFSDINVVRNTDCPEDYKCEDMYIEPMLWMFGQIERLVEQISMKPHKEGQTLRP